MANDDVTAEDLKATAAAKVEDAAEAARENLEFARDAAHEQFENAKDVVRSVRFTTNQKLALVGVVSVLASTAISRAWNKFREIRVDEVDVIVVKPENVS